MFKSAHGVIAALNERLARPRRTSRRKHRARPRALAGAIESLEDRRLLAVITVTSLLDTVEDRDEALTLREAILIANDSTGATSFEGISSTDVADTIVFDPDVFVSDSGPIFLSQQLPVVTELLTIDGAVDTRRVAIDGLNESRIFENASAGLNLRNLILQNGFVFGDGGAILNNRNAVLDLNNVDVIDSTAAQFISTITVAGFASTGGCGGGIYNGAGGVLTIADSVITRTSAEASGGGIFNAGTLAFDLSGASTFVSNSISTTALPGEGGGGIFSSGTIAVTGSRGRLLIGGNAAAFGAGLYNAAEGTAAVTNSAIFGNTAIVSGGGVYNAGDLTIEGSGGNVQIDNNRADGTAVSEGGGIFNTGSLRIDGTGSDVRLTGNAAVEGGGLANVLGTVSIIETTFAANGVTQRGGAIKNHSGTITIAESMLSGNGAFSGGAVLNTGDGVLQIGNSSIATNDATQGGAIDNQSGTVAITASTLANNTAAIDGGGLTNRGEATITDTEITGNTAGQHGGAVLNGGTLTVTGGVISENRAGGTGGGIYTLGALTITDGTVSGNEALLSGGGISVGSGTATLTRVNVTGNTAFGEHGGGLSSSATLVIADSTITANDADEEGGGIFVESGTATIANVSISGNTAGQAGGGLSNWFGAVAITDSTIADNTADGPGGGIFSGLFDSETGTIPGTLSIENGIVSGNTAEAGGGIHNLGAATITSSTISGNTAAAGPEVQDANGGGINNVGQLTITDSSVEGNTADGRGGGLFNGAGATAALAFVSVTGNSSGHEGGGIANLADLTIASSTISGNTTEGDGGGIRNASFGSESGTATLTVENSTISGNTALNGGGISAGGGSVALLSVTVASNVASGNGGGVHIGSGAVTATSTILASNAASGGPDVRGTLTDLGFSLIGNTAGMAFATGQAVSTLVNVDPRLGPLQDNGGPTFTHALLPGSPAIDKGSNPTEAAFDQRGPGFSRTRGGQTDVGAFEVQSLPAPGTIVVGSGLGSAPEIRIFDAATNQLIGSFAPFPSFFRGGIRVATGDVNGDGVADIVASAAPKAPPRVRVFDGTDLTGGTVLMDFFAYHGGFGGGVFVATGDVNNDGRADIITGAGAGGGPIAKVFSGADLTGGTVLMSFFAYDPSFRGGVQVAAGDINGDNRDDVITGAGPGGGPHVKVFSGADLTGGTALMSFFPYARSFSGGVHVAGGDINGDGRDDVITGAGFGGGPHVRAFSGADLSATTLLADFFAYGRLFRGGVRVASADVNGDGLDDIITGPGPLGGPHVRAFHGLTGERLETFFAAPPGSTRGVFVAGVSRNTTEPPPSSVPPSGFGDSGGGSVSFQLIDDLFSDTLILDELQAV